MGKGEITYDLGDGEYQVMVIYGGRTRIQNRITNLNLRIADLQTKYDEESDPVQKNILRLQIISLEKDVEYLENGMPNDPIITSVWCADRTEGLSGNVGTIEIPGEPQSFNIQPGYDENAVYNSGRDAQLFPAIACSADQAFFNKAILPGWQKWQPTYRYGIITLIDNFADTCTVALLSAKSSQQNLNVNQGSGLDIGVGDYTVTSDKVAGWEQFKDDYPTHALVTNTQNPVALETDDSLINQIRQINSEVNSDHSYQSDASYRKAGESWNILGEGEPGDCEDFALTKADRLINELGLSPRNMMIATCYAQGGDYHATLLVPTVSHGTLVLDINTGGMVTKELLDSIGFYQWDLFLINGDQWALDTSAVLEDVPIEYMDCNSLAFSPDDIVIIKFEDQDFDQPKVIGFKENPQTCRIPKIYQSLGQLLDINQTRHIEYDTETDSWSIKADPPWMYTGQWWSATGISHGTVCYLFGGEDFQNGNWYTLNLGRKYFAAYGSWTTLDSFSGTKRGRSGGFVIGINAYVISGNNYPSGDQLDLNSTIFYSDVDSIDLSTRVWTTKNNFNQISDCDGVSCSDGFGYIAGGATVEMQDGLPNLHSTTYRYDPGTDSFAVRASFGGARFNHAAFAANDQLHIACGLLASKVYGSDLYGQWAGDDMWQTRNCQGYDRDANSWSNKTSSPVYEQRHYGSKTGIGSNGFMSSPGGVGQNTYTMFFNWATNSWSYSNPSGSQFWGADGVMYAA